MKSILTTSQTQEHQKTFLDGDDEITIICNIRYDDQCGNGHNTFAITGETYLNSRCESGGCIHDEIAKHFPEFKHLIPWHLVSSDGPLHYIGNTVYHASDKDCWGLRKGEQRQLINGKSKLPSWMPVIRDKDDNEHHARGFPYLDQETQPNDDGDVKYVPWTREGEGKEPDLEAARNCVVWPDATLNQLRDKAALAARLPALLASFKSDIESLGFVY